MTEHNDHIEGMFVDDDAEYFLLGAAKWSYFLSILGFIGVGITAIMGIAFSTVMSTFSTLASDPDIDLPYEPSFPGWIWIIYIIIAVAYFFPIYYLYQFSVKLKRSIRQRDNFELTASFSYLKKHYKFIGILLIVMFILYPILIAVVMAQSFPF